MGTVFIRKEEFKKLKSIMPIKYFAFSERLIEGCGYCDETSYHFEISDSKIIKEIPNHLERGIENEEKIPEACQNCRYGIYDKPSVVGTCDKFMKLIMEYGG